MQKSSVANELNLGQSITTEEICQQLTNPETSSNQHEPSHLQRRKDLWASAFKLLTELIYLDGASENEINQLVRVFSHGFKCRDLSLYDALNPRKLSGHSITLKDAKIFARAALLSSSTDLLSSLIEISIGVRDAALHIIIQGHDYRALPLLISVCLKTTDLSSLAALLDAVVRLGTAHHRFSVVTEFELLVSNKEFPPSLRPALIQLIADRCVLAWDKQIMYRQQVENFLLNIYHMTSGHLRSHVSHVIRELDPTLIPQEPPTILGRMKNLLGIA